MSQLELSKYLEMMEEMANAPKEEYGKRQPEEKCMYEIQRAELIREAWEEGQKRAEIEEKEILAKVIDDPPLECL